MTRSDPLHEALRVFAGAITAKMTQVTVGAPEDQVRGPFEHLMAALGVALGQQVVCTGEASLPDRLGAGAIDADPEAPRDPPPEALTLLEHGIA